MIEGTGSGELMRLATACLDSLASGQAAPDASSVGTGVLTAVYSSSAAGAIACPAGWLLPPSAKDKELPTVQCDAARRLAERGAEGPR